MNVIPFPRVQRPIEDIEPLAFGIGARVDLRIGALSGGVIRPRGPDAAAYTFSGLARLLRAARMTWRERCSNAMLSLSVNGEMLRKLDPELLSEAAVEAGCTRSSLSFELPERDLIEHGPDYADELRGRGWSLSLRGDPECPLPLGAHARQLYFELVLDAPEQPGPFLAIEDADPGLLSRRIAAAKEAGLIICADNVRTAAQARLLAMAGFDRGGGQFAEAGLR